MLILNIIGGIVLFFACLFTYAQYNTGKSGVLPFMHFQPYGIKLEDIPNLTDKTILITGANSGLGLSSAKILALKNATIVMTARSLSKCNEARKELISLHPEISKNLICDELDLGSLQSIKDFSERYKKSNRPIHSLMLNGGVMNSELKLTKDGFEETVGVNHVGHFYLTNLLLDVVIKSKPSTIAVVSSDIHADSDSDVVDIESMKNPETFSAVTQYSRSKLLNVMFSNELSRKLISKEVYVNSLNPGAVFTNLSHNWNLPTIVKSVLRLVMWDSDFASITQVGVAVSPIIFQQKKSMANIMFQFLEIGFQTILR